MSNLYHFLPNKSKTDSNLILSQNYQIPERIAKCLTDFQYEGIRFLYNHFVKHQSCILNLESGLGKTALVCAFLNTVLPTDLSRKCLIIVKNEERLNNWRFHLDVLTSLTSKVAYEEKEIGQETVYLTKWESFRSSASLANINFDCVIVDDRGDLMTNQICLAYLLRNYENKVSLVIASNDVSIDLKQFHSILRLCGRLESTNLSYKLFEEKFSLEGQITGLSDDRNMLETYFLRRERIINYCRDFRLRKFRHQFNDQLPLVTPEIYQRNLTKWQENPIKNHPTLSRISNSSGSCHILTSSDDRDTAELFKSFLSKREEEELNAEVSRITTIAASENSSSSQLDNIIMSPLLFEPESNDENPDETVSSTTKSNDNRNIILPTPIKHKFITSPAKRRQKRLNQQSTTNTISRRITRGMDHVTRSKSQKSKYILLDIEKTMERAKSDIKAITKKRTKINNSLMRQIEIGPPKFTNTQLNLTSSSLRNNNNQQKKIKSHVKKNGSCNVEESEDEIMLENGQRFGDNDDININEVEIVQNTNNFITNSNCNSENPCDFSVSCSLILPDSSEIKIMSCEPPEIITLSSSTDSSIFFHNVKRSTKQTKSKPLSPSPDLFSTYDEYHITCSQTDQNSTGNHQQKKQPLNKQTTKLYDKIIKPCRVVLSNDLNLLQEQNLNTVQNSSVKTDTCDDVVVIESETEIIHKIDNSIMDRNLLINKSRTNNSMNFQEQMNKITKYFGGEEVPSTPNTTNKSSQSAIVLAKADSNIMNLEYPKTPKTLKNRSSVCARASGSGKKKTPSLKKSPNSKSKEITPNGLTRWLNQLNVNTPKRRRLDLSFHDE